MTKTIIYSIGGLLAVPGLLLLGYEVGLGDVIKRLASGGRVYYRPKEHTDIINIVEGRQVPPILIKCVIILLASALIIGGICSIYCLIRDARRG